MTASNIKDHPLNSKRQTSNQMKTALNSMMRTTPDEPILPKSENLRFMSQDKLGLSKNSICICLIAMAL